MPLAVCVEDCANELTRRILYFSGNVRITTTSAPGAAPTSGYGGGFKMGGWWDRAFGLNFLHLSMIQLQAEWINPPYPAKLDFGVQFCVGAWESGCKPATEDLAEPPNEAFDENCVCKQVTCTDASDAEHTISATL